MNGRLGGPHVSGTTGPARRYTGHPMATSKKTAVGGAPEGGKAREAQSTLTKRKARGQATPPRRSRV